MNDRISIITKSVRFYYTTSITNHLIPERHVAMPFILDVSL